MAIIEFVKIDYLLNPNSGFTFKVQVHINLPYRWICDIKKRQVYNNQVLIILQQPILKEQLLIPFPIVVESGCKELYPKKGSSSESLLAPSTPPKSLSPALSGRRGSGCAVDNVLGSRSICTPPLRGGGTT